MLFESTPLAGSWLIDLERHCDVRGTFARAFCAEEFSRHELPTHFPQANLSSNVAAGTLRGMHYNREPEGEGKLVRCVRGRFFDVIVDLRPDSSTRWRWFGVELSADNGRALYIPTGFAHGFLTLEPDTDIFYFMTEPFRPDASRGLRWNDPAFAIDWPRHPAVLSERDASYSYVDPATFDITR